MRYQPLSVTWVPPDGLAGDSVTFILRPVSPSALGEHTGKMTELGAPVEGTPDAVKVARGSRVGDALIEFAAQHVARWDLEDEHGEPMPIEFVREFLTRYLGAAKAIHEKLIATLKGLSPGEAGKSAPGSEPG